MTIFKCKMCGGDLEVSQNMPIGTCEYCGSTMTLPRLNDDKKANLYDRANHFRRNNEFDKAMSIYEKILQEDRTDSEAYWSLVLCKYGIEYVEDSLTHKRIPTCNRTQFTSIFADEDYKAAINNADEKARMIYEEEAKAIDEIQKGILEISSKEDPFDVFICYKETDNNGVRTPDSVLAQDLYYQLTEQGFKVFFARITLEDKLGSAYEPYIFAALNSSKVMIVIGTKPDYFNSAWVKNEWSRYLSLIKSGAKKTIIPAYKDMDPYDLPEEFSHLQALDMSKLGFMQDLIRGIKKITLVENPKENIKSYHSTQVSGNVEPLLKRIFLFLEDGDFASADEYCERVLDIEPENTYAYIGKLMSELRLHKEQDIALYEEETLTQNNYFLKAYRFADEKYKATLDGYVQSSEMILSKKNKYIAANVSMGTYDKLVANGNFIDKNNYLRLAEEFRSINDYRDANSLADECENKAKIILERTEKYYQDTIKEMKSKNSAIQYLAVSEKFKRIVNYKDAEQLAEECKTLASNQTASNKKLALISLAVIFVICMILPGYVDKFNIVIIVASTLFNGFGTLLVIALRIFLENTTINFVDGYFSFYDILISFVVIYTYNHNRKIKSEAVKVGFAAVVGSVLNFALFYIRSFGWYFNIQIIAMYYLIPLLKNTLASILIGMIIVVPIKLAANKKRLKKLQIK